MLRSLAATILLALFVHQVIIIIKDSDMADNENAGSEEQQLPQEESQQSEPMEVESNSQAVPSDGNKEEESSQMDVCNEAPGQVLNEAEKKPEQNMDEAGEGGMQQGAGEGGMQQGAGEGGNQQLQQEEPKQDESQKLDESEDNKTESKEAEDKKDPDADKKDEQDGEKEEDTDKNDETAAGGQKDDSKLSLSESEVKKEHDVYEMAKLKRELERNRTFTFPTSLEDFGYAFNEDGELRNIESGEKFEFFAKKDDHLYNQKRYEAIGEIITEIVYQKLEKEVHLDKHVVPTDATKEEPQTFIFMSKDALSNSDKVMVLIHGSGVVRAGQWARSLIINKNMDCGTQIPYIKRAMQEDYGVIVLNSNDNYVSKGERIPIRENGNAENHTRYVWDNFVMKSKAKHIAIVAHSYGGLCVTSLCISREKEFYQKVTAVAMTDSIHSLHLQEANDPIMNWFIKNAKNWVSSDEPLDTTVQNTMLEVSKVSAGTKKHEETSYMAMESIFKYLTTKLSNEAPSGVKDTIKQSSKTGPSQAEDGQAGESQTEDGQAGESQTKASQDGGEA